MWCSSRLSGGRALNALYAIANRQGWPVGETLEYVLALQREGRPRHSPGVGKHRGDALTRDEHLAWCKRRALEYVDAGDLTRAVASMTSDLKTHPDTDN